MPKTIQLGYHVTVYRASRSRPSSALRTVLRKIRTTIDDDGDAHDETRLWQEVVAAVPQQCAHPIRFVKQLLRKIESTCCSHEARAACNLPACSMHVRCEAQRLARDLREMSFMALHDLVHVIGEQRQWPPLCVLGDADTDADDEMENASTRALWLAVKDRITTLQQNGRVFVQQWLIATPLFQDFATTHKFVRVVREHTQFQL